MNRLGQKVFILTAALFSLSACSHKPVSPDSSATNSSAQNSGKVSANKERTFYEQGLKALEHNDYATAYKKFSDLLSYFPTTKWLPGAYYNLGLSLEGQGNYKDAAEKYKKVIEYYAGAQNRDEADALYRLSVCYEALNDDAKMIISLHELENHKSLLHHETANVELPARLAAAYARQGNNEQAQVYFSKAEVGLKKLRRTHLPKDVLIWLPKTLFSMGHMEAPKPFSQVSDFKLYTTALIKSQGWLVRAAELGHSEWSPKASQELIATYKNALSIIDHWPAPKDPDALHGAMLKQQDQRLMAHSLDESLAQLRIERLPVIAKDSEPSLITDIFKAMDEVQKHIDGILQAPDVQDQDTPEAQKRQGLKR